MGQQASAAGNRTEAQLSPAERAAEPGNSTPGRQCYSPFSMCNPDQHPDAAFQTIQAHPATSETHTQAMHTDAGGSRFGGGFFRGAMATITNLRGSSTDFAGTWSLASIDGDMDVFMQELGVSWVRRTYASAMSYGVGRSTQTITQQGSVVEVESAALGETTRSRYQIGLGRQQVTAADGSRVFTDARWEDGGRTLVVEAFTEDNVPLTTLRRSLENNAEAVRPLTTAAAGGGSGPQMLLTMRRPSGVEVTQRFRRVSAPASETASAPAAPAAAS